MQNKVLAARQNLAREWFEGLAEDICQSFEELEECLPATFHDASGPERFVRTRNYRKSPEGFDLGGGVMAKILNGKIFEKVGVNVSTVYGPLSPKLAQALTERQALEPEDQHGSFWASGISLVAHMSNPRVPAIHFNTRMFTTRSRWWFGGGTDLNPCLENEQDTTAFHAGLRQVCNRHSEDYYPKFRKWADDYFFVPHRERARGVGGIFFDDLNSGTWDRDFAFVKDTGRFFLEFYPGLIRKRQPEQWTPQERETLLLHRGLYAEFNLIYDRGTRFGLDSGHNPDAVLMSLPPIAKWN